VPFYAGTRVVIYNKDQFAAAGIDPASITSKDKLIAAAKTLQGQDKGVTDYSGLYIPRPELVRADELHRRSRRQDRRARG
jgi:ABC-type glycerol-3-phosphate transport system substrate-binding protein